MRLVYLSPVYSPYRVPVFQHLYGQLGEDFTVVTLARQILVNARLAQSMGTYPKIALKGGQIMLSRRHDDGAQTPMGLTWSPRLAPLLRQLRPHVVISDNFNLWTMTSIRHHWPTVIFWQGTAHTERTVTGWRIGLRRHIAARAAMIATNGRLSSDYVEQDLGVAQERIRVAGSCCDTLPPGFRVTPGPLLRFLFVGRLIRGKGAHQLLHATALLQRRLEGRRAFEVVLVGDGPQRPALARLARTAGLEKIVRFTGWLNPGKVWAEYARAHVFVLPTLQDNGPIAAIEAAAAGLPLLLSHRAGLAPELVEHGVNGFIIDPTEHDALATTMSRYVADPVLAALQGEASRGRARNFTAAEVANRFLRTAEEAVHKAACP